jgi:hypothetical protein
MIAAFFSGPILTMMIAAQNMSTYKVWQGLRSGWPEVAGAEIRLA